MYMNVQDQRMRVDDNVCSSTVVCLIRCHTFALAEGNAGPAIIVAPSTLGYPMSVTVRANYYESNNARPLVFEGSDGKPTAVCTELLVTGEHWNQSTARALGRRPDQTVVVGKLGDSILLSSIIVAGNSHVPSSEKNIIGCDPTQYDPQARDELTNCTCSNPLLAHLTEVSFRT